MIARKNNFLNACDIMGFTLPILHTAGGNWYVDFYANDPATGRMRRKRYMLNRYKNERTRHSMASLFVHNITAKLIIGWNPWVNAEDTRQFTEVAVVFGRYRDYIGAVRD